MRSTTHAAATQKKLVHACASHARCPRPANATTAATRPSTTSKCTPLTHGAPVEAAARWENCRSLQKARGRCGAPVPHDACMGMHAAGGDEQPPLQRVTAATEATGEAPLAQWWSAPGGAGRSRRSPSPTASKSCCIQSPMLGQPPRRHRRLFRAAPRGWRQRYPALSRARACAGWPAAAGRNASAQHSAHGGVQLRLSECVRAA